MSIFYLLILILLFMVILTFTAVLKVAFTLDTRKENVSLTLLWLYPFLKVTAVSSNSPPLLSIYLFGKKFYSREMLPKKAAAKKVGSKNADLVMAASPSDMYLDVNYGFRDPFITGITCGAINAASEYIHFASIKQSPDFVSDSDFLQMNATAKVNIGNTFLNFLKKKTGAGR